MEKSTGLPLEAYLDIETTGLSWGYHYVTVVGICLCQGTDRKLVQLVGKEVTREKLLGSLEGVETIYTYNGSRFDLPFLEASLGLDLTKIFGHQDLMQYCWQRNLFGGLKAVETTLGIPRRLKGVNGLEAVRLWWRYKIDHDQEALRLLLAYNAEDVINLKLLREKLACSP